jgi:glyoxylase-like metal-dependent hydrolase (beta-lactamase superfamily II)
MTQLVHMETVIPRLHATIPEPLPFAPSLHARAFLLERKRGNILVYSTTVLEADAAAIDDLGGIARHYLNHGHEAMFASDGVDAPLFVHENERETVERAYNVRGTFSRRHVFDDDVQVIPTPGHTSGATAYLWDSGGHRALFTGDTVYLDGGEWVAAVLEDSSDRAAYLESLELIRELDFDVLVPWAARGEPYHAVVSHAEARRRIDAIIERVRRGEER